MLRTTQAHPLTFLIFRRLCPLTQRMQMCAQSHVCLLECALKAKRVLLGLLALCNNDCGWPTHACTHARLGSCVCWGPMQVLSILCDYGGSSTPVLDTFEVLPFASPTSSATTPQLDRPLASCSISARLPCISKQPAQCACSHLLRTWSTHALCACRSSQSAVNAASRRCLLITSPSSTKAV